MIALPILDRERMGDNPVRPIMQAGALCVRRQGPHDESEVLLISSRSTGLWGIPKGHMEPGETVRQVAEREAYEEAGVRGIALEPAIGQFSYRKVPRLEQRLKSYLVAVHLVFVQGLMIDYPESGARRVEWMPMRVAAGEVANSELGRIIGRLAQHPLYNGDAA